MAMNNHRPATTIDFFGMYLAHDACMRDLIRLTAAIAEDRLTEPSVRLGWETFQRQLDRHHSTEDAALWPLVRTAATDPADLAILDEMEAEHDIIEDLLARGGGRRRHRRQPRTAFRRGRFGRSTRRPLHPRGAAGTAAHRSHRRRDRLGGVRRGDAQAQGVARGDGVSAVGTRRRSRGRAGQDAGLPARPYPSPLPLRAAPPLYPAASRLADAG
ncbi:hypothetical protein D7D52_30745 [Nocardia yunnanensis]|uniref:Hemerythrin-like domain-containing protein n=1 Tax=Nocardia yunnanensis TaxID=2382165 RepID=A0A386ZIU9_9NOCA|nr:hypothetical protein D7D52_30745 [Nocardia yunnanensis]